MDEARYPYGPTREQLRELVLDWKDKQKNADDQAFVEGATPSGDRWTSQSKALEHCWKALDALLACEGTAQPDPPLDLETLAEATAMIEGGTTEDHLERLRASGEGTAPLRYPDGLPEHLYVDMESTIHQHMGHDGLSDEANDWVTDLMSALSPLILRALAGEGTAPQVPAEVLWEGETHDHGAVNPNVSSIMDQYGADPVLPVPPGTRVRVVAADGAPQPDELPGMWEQA